MRKIADLDNECAIYGGFPWQSLDVPIGPPKGIEVRDFNNFFRFLDSGLALVKPLWLGKFPEHWGSKINSAAGFLEKPVNRQTSTTAHWQTMRPGTLSPGTLGPGSLSGGTLGPETLGPGGLGPGTLKIKVVHCK